jgi:hypothetical protein
MPDRRKLKVGDKIRIISVPSGDRGETAKVLQEIVDRGRPVRIFQIDEYKMPWFIVHILRKNGRREIHSLAIMEDDSWRYVRARNNQGAKGTLG